jgi:4Fe-4S ferredoxin
MLLEINPMKIEAETAHCKHPPGAFRPVIDPNRCEGKGPCVAACPVAVLAMGVLPKVEARGLTLIGRVKAIAHGYKQARVVHGDACRGCGDCVRVCPEHAITLARA